MSVEPMEGQAAAAESAKAPEVVVEEERAAAIEAVPVTAEDEAETETSSCFTSDASSSSLLAEEASGATVLEGGVSEDEVSEPDMSEPDMRASSPTGHGMPQSIHWVAASISSQMPSLDVSRRSVHSRSTTREERPYEPYLMHRRFAVDQWPTSR